MGGMVSSAQHHQDALFRILEQQLEVITRRQALDAGFYPFILGGIVKAVLAAAVLGGAWAVVRSTHKDRGTAR